MEQIPGLAQDIDKMIDDQLAYFVASFILTEYGGVVPIMILGIDDESTKSERF